MIASMTGFARVDGSEAGMAWAWELRSVNGRGLELRLRVPAGYDGLEAVLREAAGRLLKRGNITANLTLKREERALLSVDIAALEHVLALATDLARRIPGCPPPRAEALLALPGVLRQVQNGDAAPGSGTGTGTGAGDAATPALPAEIVRAGFEQALAGLVEARRGEGGRTAAILATLLDEISVLRDCAVQEAADQPAAQRARMVESVRALLGEIPALPQERIAQEVAMLAARSDVREELDRLASHIEAARALLDEAAPVGRRFDFLVQEFNREANTLCSKSASVPLTTTGLRLKAAIEQLREQVQNVE